MDDAVNCLSSITQYFFCRNRIPQIKLYTLNFYFNVAETNFRSSLEEFRDKAADGTEWQSLVEKIGEATGKVDNSV